MLDSFMLITAEGQKFVVAVRNCPDYKQAQRKALELVRRFEETPELDDTPDVGDTDSVLYLSYEYPLN